MPDIADPYLILDVDRGADADQIRRAFRRLIARWHPDRSDEADAADRTAAIIAAYRTLSDPERRRHHDRRRTTRPVPPGDERRQHVRRTVDRQAACRRRRSALLLRDTAWVVIAVVIVVHAVGPDIRAYRRYQADGRAIAAAVAQSLSTIKGPGIAPRAFRSSLSD